MFSLQQDDTVVTNDNPFDCPSEFQPCTSAYCIRGCLKIAQGKPRIAATEGFLISSPDSPAVHQMQSQMNISPWPLFVSPFLS